MKGRGAEQRELFAPLLWFLVEVAMDGKDEDVMQADNPSESVRAVAVDEAAQSSELERQIATLAKLLPLLRAIRNAGRQTAEP